MRKIKNKKFQAKVDKTIFKNFVVSSLGMGFSLVFHDPTPFYISSTYLGVSLTGLGISKMIDNKVEDEENEEHNNKTLTLKK